VGSDGRWADAILAGASRALSAAACAPLLGATDRIGATIRAAISATRGVVHCNTNLGIVLLAAPLCRAAALDVDLRRGLGRVLGALDRDDAVEAYAAIRLASPGGLGRSAQHDVRGEPEVSLRDAMAEAAPRDAIARQYVTGFEDVFARGMPLWRDGLALFGDESIATTRVYIGFVADLIDSHLVRRHGPAAAAAVQQRARGFDRGLRADPARLPHLDAALRKWDEELRAANMNPGTSADLTVASILAAKLMATV